MKHDRTPWKYLGPSIRRPALFEFSRQCKTCGEPFSILVTKKIASGRADTNNFALVNCPDHRRKMVRQNVA